MDVLGLPQSCHGLGAPGDIPRLYFPSLAMRRVRIARPRRNIRLTLRVASWGVVLVVCCLARPSLVAVAAAGAVGADAASATDVPEQNGSQNADGTAGVAGVVAASTSGDASTGTDGDLPNSLDAVSAQPSGRRANDTAQDADEATRGGRIRGLGQGKYSTRPGDGKPPMPGSAVLLFFVVLLGSQAGLYHWRNTYPTNYARATLVALWVIPTGIAIYMAYIRFLLLLSLFTAATAYFVQLVSELQRPLARCCAAVPD